MEQTPVEYSETEQAFIDAHGFTPPKRLHRRVGAVQIKNINAQPAAADQKKSWDVSQPSRGLGDVVKKITHATGIDKAVDFVAEKVTGKKGGCGCAKRQAALNQMVPFKDASNGQ
jgi:hypothetical protein